MNSNDSFNLNQNNYKIVKLKTIGIFDPSLQIKLNKKKIAGEQDPDDTWIIIKNCVIRKENSTPYNENKNSYETVPIPLITAFVPSKEKKKIKSFWDRIKGVENIYVSFFAYYIIKISDNKSEIIGQFKKCDYEGTVYTAKKLGKIIFEN